MTLQSKPHKIKVCLVAISLGEGGADRSCALLSHMLVAQGFDVHIAILNDNVAFSYAGTLLNLGALKLEKDNFMRRFLRLRKLKRYLKEEQIDLVIDHRPKNNYKRELFYQNYVYKDIKTIYVIHSYRMRTYFGPDPLQFKTIYSKNFKSIVVSEGIRNYLNSMFTIPNLEVIHNPFDEAWLEKAKEEVSLPNGNYLLSYGRLDDDVKDISFLLESYHKSQLWEEGFRLVLMGEGKDEYKLKSRAKDLSLTDHVEFLSFTANPFPIIAKAHGVCLTSKWEGFPMVLVESLSLGIPVVSLDIKSGPSEIIEHGRNGLLIPVREVGAFAEALRDLCLNKSLYEKCKANAKASVAKFSMAAIGKAWSNLLTDA